MLSVTAEHALRALSEMAGLERGQAILGKDLARRAAIPPNYLAKILGALGHAGMIDATRGSRGGYRLKKRPEEIRLIDIVDLFDRQSWKNRCFIGCHPQCTGGERCGAHEGWREVRDMFEKFLVSTTIAEIAGQAGGEA